MPSKNIVLVGFMGTGKTSIGKALGKRLKRPVIDVDRWVEDDQKRKISDIFERNGEPFFRALEKAAIREISKKEGIVITTGGGAVIDPENMELLKTNGWIVALLAAPETIFSRVRNSRHRPLLNTENMLEKIKKMLSERLPLYRQADFEFETDLLSSSEVAALIVRALEGKL